MKIIILVMFLLTNFAFLFGIFKLDLVNLYIQVKKDVQGENIRTFTSLITSITATLNIILVILFYNLGKKNSKLENTLTKKSYWYRNVILDPNLESIENYFKNINELATSLITSTEDEYMESFIKFKTYSSEINNGLIDLIKVSDEKFGNTLEKTTIDFEDKFVEMAIETLTDDAQLKKENFKKLFELISLEKASFYKLLYNYEFMNYEFKEESQTRFQKFTNWLWNN